MTVLAKTSRKLLFCSVLLSLFFYHRRWIRPAPISELIWKLWILQTVGRTPWMVDESVARPLRTQDNTNQRNRRHTSMPRVGFEPTILSIYDYTTLCWPLAALQFLNPIHNR
jgi:hypothetical protein